MGLFFALCLIVIPSAAAAYEFWKSNSNSFHTVLSKPQPQEPALPPPTPTA